MKKIARKNRAKRGVTYLIFDSFITIVRERPATAGLMWFGVFAVLLSSSLAFGIVPEIDTAGSGGLVATAEHTASDVTMRPIRVIIDAIGVDEVIVTPESRSIDVLDRALLDGVVHYPGSADLGESGNVFLFGHSTGFRVVQNPAFKVFNDLKNLETNDLIRLQSGTEEHVYRVTSVSLVNADEALVDLSKEGRKLTLSTCNSFGAKTERYVVEAEFIGKYALEGNLDF